MTAATLTIADFLMARIAEDEAVARHRDVVTFGAEQRAIAGTRNDPFDPARVLAECAAKRAIVERLHVECSGHPGPHMPHADYGPGFCWREDEDNDILRAVASVYADHEDFDPRWAL